MKIELNRDWTEFLSALISRRVRLLLIGGHAVARHGKPRLTENLDVFVEPTLPNAPRPPSVSTAPPAISPSALPIRAARVPSGSAFARGRPEIQRRGWQQNVFGFNGIASP